MEPAYAHLAGVADLPAYARSTLDIGGADGRLAVALARHYPHLETVVSADISSDMARRASERARKLGLGQRVRGEVHDVHCLGFDDAVFDAIVSFASLHHWRDKATGLRELDRVLKPGGTIAVMDGFGNPSFSRIRRTVKGFGGSIWTALAYWIGGKDVLTLDEIADVVECSGLRYIAIEDHEPAVVLRGTKPVQLR